MRRIVFLLFSVSICFAYQQDPESGHSSADFLVDIQQLMHEGRYDKAEQRLSGAPTTDPFVLRLQLEILQREGKREEAETIARRLLRLFDAGQLKTPDEVGQAAYAAIQLDRWQDANQLFIEAAKRGSGSVSMFVDWGNLYLERYNAAEAESIFQDAIKVAQASSGYSRWGPDAAYVGLARSLEDQFKGGTSEALDKALEINPENLSAIFLKALHGINEADFEEAERWLEKGLKINKHYVPLMELKCASEYFTGDLDDYKKTQQQVLKINPNNGDLFETLADIAVRKRRLDKAVEFYRESIQRNPRQWSAVASLGINLLRLGEEEEGKQVLERAYANDPFNIWTVNTLRLLDSFDRFLRFETPHFRVKLHQEEASALKPYVEELLEKSLQSLAQKYGHEVTGKYIFEMYPDHADFAVRTLGLPGLGALGATFGRTVAMDSPSARSKGEFHWGSTLWHEMAHVVTLSLSDHKVPRWLTEGISMMEERQAGEGWGDYLTVGFVKAYEKGDLLPLSELNAGFERPKSGQQLTLSYFQAGWVCEFLVSRYGFEKIRAMLVAFAQGETTKQVFQKVLGSSAEAIDEEFKNELDRVLKPLTKQLEEPGDPVASIVLGEGATAQTEKPKEQKEDLDSLIRTLRANPENYFLNFRVGYQLNADGREEEAIPYLQKAVEIFPTAAGKGSPYDLLSRIYEKLDRKDQALDIRRRWWKAAPKFSDNAKQVASLLSDRNQPREAAKVLEEAMYADPLQGDLHEQLGDLYLQTEQPERAADEFRIFLDMKPVDMAAAHYKLAQALLDSGDSTSARRHVLLSLEIAPGYEKAQELLLKVVRR